MHGDSGAKAELLGRKITNVGAGRRVSGMEAPRVKHILANQLDAVARWKGAALRSHGAEGDVLVVRHDVLNTRSFRRQRAMSVRRQRRTKRRSQEQNRGRAPARGRKAENDSLLPKRRRDGGPRAMQAQEWPG